MQYPYSVLRKVTANAVSIRSITIECIMRCRIRTFSREKDDAAAVISPYSSVQVLRRRVGETSYNGRPALTANTIIVHVISYGTFMRRSAERVLPCVLYARAHVNSDQCVLLGTFSLYARRVRMIILNQQTCVGMKIKTSYRFSFIAN